MRYEYDFGDDWEHEIRIEKILEADPAAHYPRRAAGKRACPQVNYTVRFAPAAARDLQRLFDFLAERDAKAARRPRSAIAKGIEFLRTFPFSCRKASPEYPLLRELIISFGANGYVALFEIEDSQTVTVLAVRHQREEDFF